jgi:KUP system potassium uptake protein
MIFRRMVSIGGQVMGALGTAGSGGVRSEGGGTQGQDPSPATAQEIRPEPHGRRLAVLALAALGVVYGDIGTSPLYAFRECFHGEYGTQVNPANILGVLSLMFWALILIVSLKYLTFILRADNRGEGGIIALTAQVLHTGPRTRATGFLVMIGLFASALLYGDGMITPAISVLSAVEGVGIAAPAFQPWVEVATVAILVVLFLLQRRGTHGVGILFGPVTTLWFLVLAWLGVRNLVEDPSVLAALNPLHGLLFLGRGGAHGFLVLGAVFLVVTGAEALFADLGHFGRRPIRLAWYGLVLPSLLCNYFGQGALLLAHPEESHHPFYAMAPAWAMIPLIVLATAATVIASQAVISGAFSLTRQAIQLGYLPRLRIIHTSPTESGQIYIPQVNWALMLAAVGLVLGFHSSSQLAAAYGVAVTATMTIASILFFAVARRRWGWSLWVLGPLVALFLTVDLSFLAANLGKIGHGAWFPLAVAAVIYTIMSTWKRGREVVVQRLYGGNPSLDDLVVQVAADPPSRVPGSAVFLAGSQSAAPPALVQNLRVNRVLHEQNVILTIVTGDVPYVALDQKVEVEALGEDFARVTARCGYMEQPNVPHLLVLAREKGLKIEVGDALFFLGRERILPHRRPAMWRWREALFAFLSLNAMSATRYFRIPRSQVVELGSQVEV